MQRTQISLTEVERALLDARAAATGRSMSALIREAVRATYGPHDEPEADLAALALSAGAWERAEDGATYVEHLRSGRRLG